MGMLDEIEKFMLSADSSINYRILNLGGKSVYVEGIKSVVSFGENEMLFQLKKSLLKIQGQALKVKYLDKTTSVIIGDIKRVEVE